MSNWPKDTATAKNAFYGDPGNGEIADKLVPVTPPFRMTYDKKPVTRIMFHEKAAPALASAFQKIWDHFGHDQEAIDRAGVSVYGGAYNHRPIRGTENNPRWSSHAYGMAIDLDPERNALGVKVGKMDPAVVAAFESEGARWGGRYKNRKDWMHFEFVDNGLGQTAMPGPLPDFMNKGKKGPAATHGNSSVEIEVVQKRLSTLGYKEVGTVDGLWGGKTAAAIAAFKNDRHITGLPIIDDAFREELDVATREGWMRPIAVARADATEKDVAQKVPEIAPIRVNKFAAIWASVSMMFTAFLSSVADHFKEGVEWVSNVKDYFADIPGYAWFGIAAVVAAFFAWTSIQGAKGITKAYNEGERS